MIDGENIKFASVQSPHQVSLSINAADMVEASDVTIVPFFVAAVAMCCIDKGIVIKLLHFNIEELGDGLVYSAQRGVPELRHADFLKNMLMVEWLPTMGVLCSK